MSDGPSADRLAALRERWQAEPASRLFLQLGEEHRSLGQWREALEVLDAGLRHHPSYFAALVAKGRCHLELGEATAAREALERAVRLDAMNGVASKLLVRAHLAAGEPERARERLDLYRLLYDGDPEIAELSRAIAGQAAGPAPSPEPSPLEAPPPITGDAFDLAPAAAAPASAAAPGDGGGEPFPDLIAAADARRYLEGLAAEGIFAIDVEPPPVEAVEVDVAEVPEVIEVAPPEPEAAREEDDIFGLGAPAPVQGSGGDVFAFPERQPPPPAPAEPQRAGETSATVTLGELYLRQGHVDEAARIFREVLRRDPGNAGAREALERLAGPPARPLGAADLLAGFAGPDEPRARKIHLLGGYLQRLRRRGEGSRPDVP